MPAEAGIQVRDFSGFRIALASRTDLSCYNSSIANSHANKFSIGAKYARMELQ
jgi:hypothetical protein